MMTSAQLSEHDVNERRQSLNAIPDNVARFLNREQSRALRQSESFGWRLAFIRRSYFQCPLVVMQSRDGASYSVIEEDGTLNANPDIAVRACAFLDA